MFIPYKKDVLYSNIDYKKYIELQTSGVVSYLNRETTQKKSKSMIKTKLYQKRMRRGMRND